MDTFTKDPNAIKDYQWDWSAWLSGDTISTSAFFVDDPALVIETSSIDGTKTIVRLSGGVNRKRYLVTNRITTATGQVDDWSVRVKMAEQ